MTLSELQSSAWTVVSTRNDEAAEVLNDVLGMGKEQFAKVAMLPQGEFAAFLTAKDDDRRALLEKLFDITRYADVEEWLVDERRASEATVSSLRSGIDTDLARLADVVASSGVGASSPHQEDHDSSAAEVDARILDGRPALDPTSPEAIRDLLEVTTMQLDTQLSEAMVALDAAVATERAAADDAERARTVSALREKARAARATLADLDLLQDDITAARATHDAASRAASVRGHIAAIAREASETERLNATRDVAEARVRAIAPEAATPTSLLEDLHLHDDTLA